MNTPPNFLRKKPKAKPETKQVQTGQVMILPFLIIGIFFLYNAYKGTNFIQLDKDGEPQLSEQRQEKLNKKFQELDAAEQYVLVATAAKFYSCYSCLDTTHIFLFPGEVWRYGSTTKGKKGRYTDKFLNINNLDYLIQYEGTLQECLEEELRKIYNYAILPENLKRKKPIIRPPGNKNDT